jgi:RNA polymerase sigma-70 factor (ECF subfamily)
VSHTPADITNLLESHRQSILAHCYRMTGSLDDAEDLLQETWLRAWRSFESFEGRSSLRTWLYSVATRVTLDHLRVSPRRPSRYPAVTGMGASVPPERVPWIQPIADAMLDTAAAADDVAGDVVARETIELGFVFALQFLPPRQRAVFILRDVIGLSAIETASALDVSIAGVNSALQRGRATLRERVPAQRAAWRPEAPLDDDERIILDRYMRAAIDGDVAAMIAMLHDEVTLTMPPLDAWFVGRETLETFLRPVFDPRSDRYIGEWRHLPTRVNRMPAVAAYVRPPGEHAWRPQVLDVLRVADGKIIEITAFAGSFIPRFGLPDSLRPDR